VARDRSYLTLIPLAMPQGTPYFSFALPYPIRVDCFTCTDHLPPPYNAPALYLLTHTHTDHTLGLSSKSFAAPVVCSPDAKEMLLRHEVYLERAKKDAGEARTRTFAHLKVDTGALKRDLLVSAISSSMCPVLIHFYEAPSSTEHSNSI
jgi:hypothetical protein